MATGAALAPPPPPCSISTATARAGLSAGARATNQAWSSDSKPPAAKAFCLPERDHLGRAGLPCHEHPFHPGSGARSTGVIHHPYEPLLDELDVLRLDLEPPHDRGRKLVKPPVVFTHPPDRLGLVEVPTIEDRTDEPGHLEGGGQDIALSYGHGDGLAALPGLAESLELPLARGDQPFFFRPQIELGFDPKAAHVGSSARFDPRRVDGRACKSTRRRTRSGPDAD